MEPDAKSSVTKDDAIIKEGENIVIACKDTQSLDTCLVAAAQAVEHYEIAR